MNDEELYREIKSGAFSMQIADCDKNIRIQFEKQKEENEFLKSEIEEAKRILQKYLEYIDERDERINKAIKYLENNSLYEEEYDYDYEENSYLSGIDDETAKKDLLKILRGK